MSEMFGELAPGNGEVGMNVALTDILVCPRCGPPHGLVLLADRVEDRRVLAGVLGCPNCGERYPVKAGLADLRPSGERSPVAAAPAVAPGEASAGASAAGAATRLAALMGLAGAGAVGRAVALVLGPAAVLAPALAAVAGDVEVVAADLAVAGWPEAPDVSRLLVAGRLPFFDRSVRGVTLSGEAGGTLLEEGLRVLHPLGRLVLEGAGPVEESRARVEQAGGRVLAAEGATVVAAAWR